MGGAIAGAVGSIAGGIAGQQASSGDLGEARNQSVIANQILQEIAQAPDISKPLILEKYKQAGILTPQMEQMISSGPSSASQVGTDQQSLDAQRQALQQMQERAKGGLTAGDRGALNQAQMQAQADTESKNKQILQQAQAQMGGEGSTGRTLAAQLQNAQSGANQRFSNANQVAQMAAQNALQATSASGQLGGQINQQQFGEAMQKASAADEMKRFNTQNQIAQQQRNVGTSNQAQAANLANLQGINNMNTQGQNNELNNQLQRQMQQWQGNVDRARLQSGGANALSGSLNQMGTQAGQNAYNQWAGAGQAVGGLMGDLGGSSGGSSGGSGGGGSVAGLGSLATMVAYDGGQVPNFKQGGTVPGKANVPGDSPKNDTVHAMVSPGEIIVPRSLADSKLGKELIKLINAHNSVKNKLNDRD